MTDDEVIQLGNSRPLNLAVYLALVVLWGVGLVILPDSSARVGVTLICLAFGLVHTWGQRAAITPRKMMAYFITQTALITGLLILSGTNDAFNFLFFILTIQAAMALPRRLAIAWVLAFFLVNGLVVLWSRGADGLLTVLFNIAVYSLTAVFGHALRQSELNRRHNQHLLDELRAMQRQLQELAVAEERNRLALDLHDSVKQQAFAASAQLGAARALLKNNPPAAEARLAEAENLMDGLRQELAYLIFELRPPALEQKNLVEALQAYVAEWSRQSGILAKVNVRDEHNLAGMLAKEVEQMCLRLVQEALSNIARHSRATLVEVELKSTLNRVTQRDLYSLSLSIVDNGVGFEVAAVTKGVGLNSMRQRVEKLGGQFTVLSEPGNGTRLTAQLERFEG